jgi:predicted RNase H-like HicB family nuclease
MQNTKYNVVLLKCGGHVTISLEVNKMKFRVILEPSEEGGYTVIVPSLPGCVSEGNTREEALKNVREAIELYLEPVEDDLSFSPDSEQLEIAL